MALRRRAALTGTFGMALAGALAAAGPFAAEPPAQNAGRPAASRTAGVPAPDGGPVWAADGRLQFPSGYREGVFLSAGLDMSYTETGAPAHSEFDNVFVNRSAWEAFQRSGTWPDGTLLVLEVRAATGRGSINRRGRFQTQQVLALEAHVRDSARFEGGWGFFSFDGREPAARLPGAAPCYACHAAHGTVDTTFVQFYPTLQAIAAERGTLRPESPHH